MGQNRMSAVKLYTLICVVFVFAIFSVFVWHEWSWLYAYLIAINIVTLVLYGFDKSISHTRVTRIPEKVLHTLALLGGSPAALLAQQFFRHKTRKKSFQFMYWGIVLLQVGIVAWYFWYKDQ